MRGRTKYKHISCQTPSDAPSADASTTTNSSRTCVQALRAIPFDFDDNVTHFKHYHFMTRLLNGGFQVTCQKNGSQTVNVITWKFGKHRRILIRVHRYTKKVMSG